MKSTGRNHGGPQGGCFSQAGSNFLQSDCPSVGRAWADRSDSLSKVARKRIVFKWELIKDTPGSECGQLLMEFDDAIRFSPPKHHVILSGMINA